MTGTGIEDFGVLSVWYSMMLFKMLQSRMCPCALPVVAIQCGAGM